MIGLTRSAEIVGGKIIRSLVGKLIDEPAMTQRAVCDIRHTQLFGSLDQTIRLVHSLESRVLGLKGVDLSD